MLFGKIDRCDDDNALHSAAINVAPSDGMCPIHFHIFNTTWIRRAPAASSQHHPHQFITINYVCKAARRSATDYKSLLLKFALKQLQFQHFNFPSADIKAKFDDFLSKAWWKHSLFIYLHTLKLSAWRGTVGRSSLFVGYGFNMQIKACLCRYNMAIYIIYD